MCAEFQYPVALPLYTERDADTNGIYEVVVRVRLGVVVKKGNSALTGNRTVIDQPAGRNIWFSCGEVSLTSHNKNLCVIILHFCVKYKGFLKKKPWKPTSSKVPRFSDFSLKGHGFHSKPVCVGFIVDKVQGGSNMAGTDLCVNNPHCAAAVRPWESEATTSTLPPALVRTCSVLSGSC